MNTISLPGTMGPFRYTPDEDGLRSVVTKISLVAKARGYAIDPANDDIRKVLSLAQQLGYVVDLTAGTVTEQ